MSNVPKYVEGWVSLNEALTRAITERNARMVGSIVDRLWFKHRVNYADQYEIANRLTGISLADWDELLREADEI